MRLGGAAFEDDVKWADGPEEQATKANIKAAIGSDGPAPSRFVSSLLREVIGIGRDGSIIDGMPQKGNGIQRSNVPPEPFGLDPTRINVVATSSEWTIFQPGVWPRTTASADFAGSTAVETLC